VFKKSDKYFGRLSVNNFKKIRMKKENWFINGEIFVKEKEVLERCENWLDSYIEKFLDSAEYCGASRTVEEAIDLAKDDLNNEFDKIQKQSELISVDSTDEKEEYNLQKNIILKWSEKL
jgi:hypothetical protein